MKRLWSNSLVSKFFLTYLGIVFLLVASFYLYSSAILRNLYISSLGARMEREARLLARTIPFQLEGVPLDALSQNLSRELGARITFIALDGRVLGDSAEPSATLENHGARPEIVEAIATGIGSSVGYSTTVGNDLLYRAFLQLEGENGRVVRIAIPLDDVTEAISALRRTLLIGLLVVSSLGLLLAYAFSRYLSDRIKRLVEFSREVARGSFPQNFFSTSRQDEINLLEQHLNEMSANIRDNIQQVVAEKEKADSILRCMVEGVLVLDPKGRVLVINDQAKKMFNVLHDRDIHGASITELSRHPEMRQIIQEVLAFDFTNDRYSKEVELDEGRWFRVNAVSLRNEHKGIMGSILVFHDTTEIKRFETLRSDFVANVSHELRTPLTAIRGYVETLLSTPPNNPKESEHFLEIIERHAERLTRLTEDLLTLSDLESGRVQLSLEPIEAKHLIQRVLEVFQDRAVKKGVELSHLIETGLPLILGDSDRLQQLLINLVDNAVKYTPTGGRVEIRASRPTQNNGSELEVELTVADTGSGIPEKDLPRLTERVYRVDKARSRELGGTGLGLAIVKHIVQAHKGELKIESWLNRGTTVRVFLHAATEDQKQNTTLFLCTGNSCRSQMAEGFARHLAPDTHRVYSAGTSPRGIHPLAIQVMKEVGIDIAGQRSKGLEDIPLDQIQRLVTLCGDAGENCPTLPKNAEQIHWSLRDPALAHGSEQEILRIFREVRDEIRDRVERLFAAVSRERSDQHAAGADSKARRNNSEHQSTRL